MPGEGGEVVDLGKRRVEKNIAKRELQQDAEIDERVGDEIKDECNAAQETARASV